MMSAELTDGIAHGQQGVRPTLGHMLMTGVAVGNARITMPGGETWYGMITAEHLYSWLLPVQLAIQCRLQRPAQRSGQGVMP